MYIAKHYIPYKLKPSLYLHSYWKTFWYLVILSLHIAKISRHIIELDEYKLAKQKWCVVFKCICIFVRVMRVCIKCDEDVPKFLYIYLSIYTYTYAMCK